MTLVEADTDSIGRTLDNTRRAMLDARVAVGHWEGELSSSALSTATAVFALWVYLRETRHGVPVVRRAGPAPRTVVAGAHESVRSAGPTQFADDPRTSKLIRSGAAWLARHQNADGGWGDTTDSISNISTTALCWAALSSAGETTPEKQAVARASAWLTDASRQPCSLSRYSGGGLGWRPCQTEVQAPTLPSPGVPGEGTRATYREREQERIAELDPKALAEAIARRYGKDRTFSVPILTCCALAGRLGPPDRAWKLVSQLPFELAALPQSWFRFARLPVVSYALPALIAIGHVRHRHRPTRNPLAWLARRLAGPRTLRVLRAIQPPGGGFLEATPLTSFVVMSLAAGGQANNDVVSQGIAFLVRSARPDGSWPIDTNLATWVTTLSVNALAIGGRLADHLGPDERKAIRDWLVGQQYRGRHPYTGAPPGGWAWTDLPGGVPDADDTAGALLALHHLGDARKTDENADNVVADAARAAVRWLIDLQNRDGGIPTFCKGWGNLPFDRSAPDLTAHALLAFNAWRDRLPTGLAAEMDRSSARMIAYLQASQRTDGSWAPLWFGNQAAPDDENPTYGTSRVLATLLAYGSEEPATQKMIDRGLEWLLSAQTSDGGWGGAPGVPASVEETSQTLVALAGALGRYSPAIPALADAVARGARWLAQKTNDGQSLAAPQPIGLYFAKLWYSERLYPLIGMTAALGAVKASTLYSLPLSTRHSNDRV